MSKPKKRPDWAKRFRRWARIPKWQRRIVGECFQKHFSNVDWNQSFADQFEPGKKGRE